MKNYGIVSISMLLICISTVIGNESTTNQSQLILNVPSGVDFARESLNLTIQLPNKIKPSEEAKKLQRSIIRRKHDFDSKPFKRISSKSRFVPIMRNFSRKGILTSKTDKRQAENRKVLSVVAARIVIRVYQVLKELNVRNSLRSAGIRKQDILDLKELVDENQKDIKMMTYSPTEIHSDLDQLLQKVNKTTGKGAIRITGLQESDDGTTINLFITKE
ncbi:MAG: hypothetical protein VX619_00650 [bacterium]|nr:hypothetical protein [bacterium]